MDRRKFLQASMFGMGATMVGMPEVLPDCGLVAARAWHDSKSAVGSG